MYIILTVLSAYECANGIDWHLDWGASQFLSKQFLVGAVGYFYDQITADSGAPQFLGANESPA